MTAAALCAAAALLAWPPVRPSGRVSGARGEPRSRAGMPPPALIGAGTVLVVAVLSTPLVAVLAGSCALLGGRWLRLRRTDARAADELLALAEALAVLAAELAAGREFSRAVTAAGKACPHPATAAALVAALRDEPGDLGPAGGPVPDALDRVRRSARLSRRTGCSLAAVATALVEDLRARHRAGLELRSATAGPRASAAVLAGLPLVGIAMGSGIGADPWQVLTGTGTGQVLLVAGVLLEVLGIGWTGRLLRRAVPDPGPPAAQRVA